MRNKIVMYVKDSDGNLLHTRHYRVFSMNPDIELSKALKKAEIELEVSGYVIDSWASHNGRVDVYVHSTSNH